MIKQQCMTKTGHTLLFYQGKFKMNRGKTVNIRKNIDYSEMYEALDILMQKNLPQMELYCEIGKAVCRRTEKGAAVMASEYLNEKYPDAKGFSPRSLRRMRDFYRTYENHPTLLSQALKLGWIQNVVIIEADLTMDLREWYMKAAEQFNWTKTELITNIACGVHEKIMISFFEEACGGAKKDNKTKTRINVWALPYPERIVHEIKITLLRLMIKHGRRRRFFFFEINMYRVMLCKRFHARCLHTLKE